MGWRDRWQVDNDGMPHRVKPIEVPMTPSKPSVSPTPTQNPVPDADPADHSKSDYERVALPAAASLVPFFSAPKKMSVSVRSSSDGQWDPVLVTFAAFGAAEVLGVAATLWVMAGDLQQAAATMAFGPVEQYQNRLTNPDNVPDGM